MKRCVLTIIVFLLLGAIVNVVVVVALVSHPPRTNGEYLLSTDQDLWLLRKAGWPIKHTNRIGHRFAHQDTIQLCEAFANFYWEEEDFHRIRGDVDRQQSN